MEKMQNVVTTVLEKIKKNFLVVFLAIMVGSGVTGLISYQVMPISSSHVENVFVDVNGDGLIDHVISAEVVINNNKVPLLQNQQ